MRYFFSTVWSQLGMTIQFIFNFRYWGEDGGSKGCAEDKSLQNLLSKVEERRKKQKRKIDEDQPSPVLDTTKSPEEPREKKSKANIEHADTAVVESNATPANDDFTVISNVEIKKSQKVVANETRTPRAINELHIRQSIFYS